MAASSPDMPTNCASAACAGSTSRSTRSIPPNSPRSPGVEGFDLVIIEVMPMGDIGGENRLDQYLPLSLVRARLQRRWALDDSDYRTGGPARYATVRETGGRLGFITHLTHNCF